jgi:large conductance mechanosensitive channel
MGMLKEFKEFAVKGNVVDMAVGIIIGGAFGKIITSLVNDIIMPPIGKLLGNVNFSDLFVSLDSQKTAGIDSLAKAKETGAALIAYGAFVNVVLDFIIMAFCIFLVVKGLSALKKQKSAVPTTKECPQCLMTIPLKAARCGHCTSTVV